MSESQTRDDDPAAAESVARLFLVYLLTLLIPIAGLYHVVVSTTDATFLFLHGAASVSTVVFDFLIPVPVGNTLAVSRSSRC